MTLSEFLLARIAEDEANEACPCPDCGQDASEEYRARVLAECEAKRRIVELLEVARAAASDFVKIGADQELYIERHAQVAALARVISALAEVHADHPDYDESWRALGADRHL